MKPIHFVPDVSTQHLSEQDSKRYFSIVGLAVFALAAVNVGVQFLFAFLARQFLPLSWRTSPLFSYLLSMIPLYLFALPVFLLILRRLPAVRPLSQPIKAGAWFGGLCVAFLFMQIGNYIGQMLMNWMSLITQNSFENPVSSATSGSPVWLNLIFLAILAPILEELVFRKLLCDRLLPLGEGYAVVISGIAFGLFHGNFFQFFYACALGILFGYVYVKSGKIIWSILYHVTINLLGGVFSGWLVDKIDMDALTDFINEAAETGVYNISAIEGQLPYLMMLVCYSFLLYGLAIVGIIYLIRTRKKIHLESGLLPPPAEKRVSTVLLTPGVALAIAFFAFLFVISLL